MHRTRVAGSLTAGRRRSSLRLRQALRARETATLITLVALGQGGSLTNGLAAAIVSGACAAARGLWEIVGRRAAAKYERLAEQLSGEVRRLAEPTPDSDES